MIKRFYTYVKQSFVRQNYRFTNYSPQLGRSVTVDVLLPLRYRFYKKYPLIIFNDGQDFEALGMKNTLKWMYKEGLIKDAIIVGVHCNENRMYEYGTLEGNHYAGYGNKAYQYNQFIVKELLLWLQDNYGVDSRQRTIAGFSLGGLSALDIAWNNADIFSKIGAFSASLWWRSRPFDEKNPDADRIMIETIANGKKRDGLKFWFQVGTRDEEDDRNNNGIIDAIDDTQDAINTLLSIGYKNMDINYEEVQDGEHNPKTWGSIMPAFLIWAIGNK